MERKFRAVHELLKAHNFDNLMVSVGGGQNFGKMTVEYLGRLRAERGVTLAVCTEDYGEMTESPYSSNGQLTFALETGLDVIPFVDQFPPNQPTDLLTRQNGFGAGLGTTKYFEDLFFGCSLQGYHCQIQRFFSVSSYSHGVTSCRAIEEGPSGINCWLLPGKKDQHVSHHVPLSWEWLHFFSAHWSRIAQAT